MSLDDPKLDDLKRVEMGHPAVVHTVYITGPSYKKLPNNGKVDLAKYAKGLPKENAVPRLFVTPLWCRTGSDAANLHELFNEDICSSEAFVTVETRKELCMVDGSDLRPLQGNGNVWAVEDVNKCCKILEKDPTLKTAFRLLDRPRPEVQEVNPCCSIFWVVTIICFAFFGLYNAVCYII